MRMFGGAGFGTGFIVGFGTGFISRELSALAVAVAKPVAKSLVKAGMMTVEKSKESLAYLKESFDDMIAEVRESMEMHEPIEAGAEKGEDKKSEAGPHKAGEISRAKQHHKGSST
jgi:hypothetical protein